MMDLKKAAFEFSLLEELASNDSVIHRLNPLTKTITTFIYVVIVVSFDRHDVSGLMPYFFYPVILAALSDTPYKPLLSRLAVSFPFCFFAGVSNLFFEKEIAIYFTSQWGISFGVLSFTSILTKMLLTVMAVLLLISTTSMPVLARQLIRLKVPSDFVLLLSLTYRYISVLVEESVNMYTAYRLRAGAVHGIKMKDMGVFLGQLLLRSMDRAERVYSAMKCRGFSGDYAYIPTKKIPPLEVCYIVILTVLFLLFRFVFTF